jgi:hypothetical protein
MHPRGSPSARHVYLRLITWSSCVHRRRSDPVVAQIEDRIARWTHLPVDHQERMQVRPKEGDRYTNWSIFCCRKYPDPESLLSRECLLPAGELFEKCPFRTDEAYRYRSTDVQSLLLFSNPNSYRADTALLICPRSCVMVLGSSTCLTMTPWLIPLPA